MLTILGIMTARTRDPAHMARFAKQAEVVGMRLFTPASFILLGLGLAAVEEGGWGYSQGWIQAGLTIWGISALTGMLFFGPQTKRLNKVIAEHGAESAPAQDRIRLIIRVARVDTSLLMLAVFFMTAKPF